ncbi:Hypothetical predicted protein [Olea europaea subsp. europaea]|uniref:Uncharacterized protein n=1 Tax=Olea europaea subsp. europaea TaxID=158383 RepID=A0A8S0QFY3_OLEEU|nr:Hypothetical predicted protein [Olea europaea subsp. europaea]
MAYRRRQQQQVGRFSTTLRDDVSERSNNFNYDFVPPPPPEDSSSSSSSSSLAAKAMRASSAYQDSSLSSAYGQSALPSPRESIPVRSSSPSSNKESPTHEYASVKNMNEPKQGFWGVLARKAKSIVEDDNTAQPHETLGRTKFQMSDKSSQSQYHNTYNSSQSRRKTDSPSLQKGLDAIASSLNYIGGTIGNALEEGLTTVENRTADIIQETRKIQIRKKNNSSVSQNRTSDIDSLRQQPMMQTHMHTDLETQLKASRDVAMAMAAKAKLLLRELKTVKADLAFAKERCAQLEEENKVLRESREKGDNPEDDDLIRVQLETLLAEKARLAQENSVFARENRFLREVVEYHQLTMQDVVYLDEGSEEVTEVYPVKVSTGANQQPLGTFSSPSPPPTPTPTVPIGAISQVTPDVSPLVVPSQEPKEVPETIASPNPYIQMPADNLRRQS